MGTSLSKVGNHKTTRCHIPEEHSLNFYLHEDRKSHLSRSVYTFYLKSALQVNSEAIKCY
jgi:hypothetical protein